MSGKFIPEKLYESLKRYRESRSQDDSESPSAILSPLSESLKLKLRPYQEEAVRWMVGREKISTTDRNDSEKFVFNGFDVLYPKGGILADEMGLGKTIEVLACILCHPYVEPSVVTTTRSEQREISPVNADRPSGSGSRPAIKSVALAPGKRKSEDEESPVTKKKTRKSASSGINSDKYASLKAWYEQSLKGPVVGPNVNYSETYSSLKCFCDQPPKKDEVVMCESCRFEQHRVCVGASSSLEDYFCPWCWSKRTPEKSRSTLIVSPSAISHQWMDEIKRYITSLSLKAIFYDGVKQRNYVQPQDLADTDVVITTYQVLSTELTFVHKEESTRKLRHAKKYHTPVSPLTCVKWWRLCLDEAQMVEGGTSNMASMARQLHTVHKWAVTGTPIQKTIHDLYGLIRFLDIEPFTEQSIWEKLVRNEEKCYGFLAPILWRNVKKDVFEQIGVPPQTTLEHWLTFSPVEGYFYQRTHTECADAFQQRVVKFINPELVRIKDIDRSQLNKILMPLLKLRQACIHPQVIRGKYVKFKHTMTMEELMLDMVGKAKVDLTNALRAVVSSLNGLAGLNWIIFNYGSAIECYRTILQTAKDYESSVKIDTLQMIHTLHNLAEALEGHGTGIPHTLRDSSLRQEAQALEEYYLKKTERLVNLEKSNTSKLTEIVDQLLEGKPLGYTTWWEDLLRGIKEDGELISRITTYLDDCKLPGQTSLANRVQNLPSVLRVVAIWLADADLARSAAMKSLNLLQNVSTDVLSSEAVDCHLSKRKKNRRKKLCQLCSSHDLLKKYETLIFSIFEQNEEGDSAHDDHDDLDVDEGNKKLVANLKDVEIYKNKKEGSWKPSPQEGIIRVLASYVKTKRLQDDWIQDSTKHLLLLGAVKKEFKSLRALWQKISNLVAATDEISMAKLRLRLPTVEEELSEGNSSTKPKKKIDTINIVQEHEIPYLSTVLSSELESGRSELKRTAGVLLYLKNLQESGQIENQLCPVCQDPLTERWSVLRCGHCLCYECIPTLLRMSNMRDVECPLCRLKTLKGEVSFVLHNKTAEEPTKSDIRLTGSFSTKVEAVTTQLLQLRSNDPDVKVIIFSTWEKVLDVLSEALKVNNVSFRRLGSVAKYKNGLTQFKNGPVTALLIPLARGSKGLNVTEATHVFLVEPILNPAEELQAVGRVHRIGQTKPTFVHRFIIHNTVEEKMARSVEPEGWSDGHFTVAEVFNLFRVDSEPSVQTSQPTVID